MTTGSVPSSAQPVDYPDRVTFVNTSDWNSYIVGNVKDHIADQDIHLPSTLPFDNILYVYTSGTDSSAVDGSYYNPYKTIKYALDQITDNSVTQRYTIIIGPGIFNEENPIQLKSYVSVKSIGGSVITRIVSTVSNQTLFLGTTFSELSDVALQNTSGSCYEMTETLSSVLNNIVFVDSKYWLKLSNASAQVVLKNSSAITTPISGTATDTGFVIDSGKLILTGILITDTVSATTICQTSGENSSLFLKVFDCLSSNIVTGFKCLDNSELNVNTFDIRNAVSAFSIDTSGYSHLFGGYIKNCTQGISIVGNTSKSEIVGVFCDDCTTDITATSGTVVLGTGNGLRNDRMSVDDSDFIMSHISELPGDKGFEIKGELHVGSPEKPTESVFGQGDSYVNGMLVYQGDEISATTNVTTSAQSVSDSTFSFESNSANECLYFGSDLKRETEYFEHYGVKLLIDTSANGGEIVIEYYNQLTSAWAPVHYMVSDSNSPYYPCAEDFELPAGSYQIRYDDYELSTINWGKNDPINDGNDRYWIRWRIVTPFTQLPIFEQSKLHSSRFEINSDGWFEYFGKGRPIGTLPWSFSMLGKNVSLGNESVFIGDNISVTYTNNVWNSNGDIAGFHSPIPLDCDTSTPIKLSWAVRCASTGTASWAVRWSYTNDGSTIYNSSVGSPTSAVNEQIITTSGTTTEDQQKWFSVRLDISKLKARIENGFPDIIWVSIERTASTGNLTGFAINPEYLKWSSGGHSL